MVISAHEAERLGLPKQVCPYQTYYDRRGKAYIALPNTGGNLGDLGFIWAAIPAIASAVGAAGSIVAAKRSKKEREAEAIRAAQEAEIQRLQLEAASRPFLGVNWNKLFKKNPWLLPLIVIGGLASFAYIFKS
jgi:hypothetical protein